MDKQFLNIYTMVESYDYMSSGEIEKIKSHLSSDNDSMKRRDYDCPQNKWELTLPSKETRLKNRKKRKYKK